MPIVAECPECGFKGNVPDQYKGKKVKCRDCNKFFVVGGAAAAAAGTGRKSNPDVAAMAVAEETAGGDSGSLFGSDGGNPFDFESPPPPPPEPARPARKPQPAADRPAARKPAPAAAQAAPQRPRPARAENAEPFPLGALILGVFGVAMGAAGFIVADKGLVGLASVPVAGFGLILAIGGVVMAWGRKPAFVVIVPLIATLVCLGAIPVGGYQTYLVIASGALDSGSGQAKNATNREDSKDGKDRGDPAPETRPDPKTPIVDPSVPPPTPADQWADAKIGFRVGKALVKVLGVEADLLRGANGKDVSKEKALLVRIQVQNVGTGDMDYFGWGIKEPSGDDTWPQLTDDANTNFKRAALESGPLVNQVKPETLSPGKSVSDVLAFDLPPDSINFLRLEMPASYVGEPGKVRIQIPKPMLAAFVKTPKGPDDPPIGLGKVARFVEDQRALLKKAKLDPEKIDIINAIGGMKRDGAPAAADIVVFLRAGSANVRAAAAKALGDIGPPAKAYIPDLTKALDHEFWRVKANAARALGEMGPDAKEAIPKLVALSKSKDEEVPDRAKEAIRRIDPKALPK